MAPTLLIHGEQVVPEFKAVTQSFQKFADLFGSLKF